MDFSEFGEPTVPSSSPGSTDSNTGMQPILLPVNPSVFTLAPPMSYPGEGNPHARLNEDVDRHPLSAYPGTDLTTALHNPIAAKYEESPGDLKIVPYKVQNRNTKRESSGGRAFRVNALINDKASSLDDLYRGDHRSNTSKEKKNPMANGDIFTRTRYPIGSATKTARLRDVFRSLGRTKGYVQTSMLGPDPVQR